VFINCFEDKAEGRRQKAEGFSFFLCGHQRMVSNRKSSVMLDDEPNGILLSVDRENTDDTNCNGALPHCH
jgi:hypothetical protein